MTDVMDALPSSANIHGVGSVGGKLVLTMPRLATTGMSKQQALNLAAYLLTMSLASDAEWQAALDAVQQT